MNKNIGFIDRALRAIVGVALLSLVFFLEGSIRWVGLVGILPLLFAVFGVCPLYTMLGINTCPIHNAKK